MELEMNSSTEKRLRILGDDEIEALYGRPRFTDEERDQYIALSESERALLQEFRSVLSQTFFILQLGYFKAKHLFFTFDLHEAEEDAQYVLEQHFPPGQRDDHPGVVNKRTTLRQRRIILERFQYRPCAAEEWQQLQTRARQVAKVSSKPIYVFRELIQYLA